MLATLLTQTGRAQAAGVVPAAGLPVPFATGSEDNLVVDARDALRRRDRAALAGLRAAALALPHPLAMWVDYWDARLRIGELQQADVDAFDARWPGSYVEDRFRNDWLLELGRRRDFGALAAVFPRFRMNDDREASCYALLADHLTGRSVRDAALAAWLAQRDVDDGCSTLAATLVTAGVLTQADAWRKARLSMDAGRPAAARAAALLASPGSAATLSEVTDAPARYLATKAGTAGRAQAELAALALIRLAAQGSDVDAGPAAVVAERWERRLPPDLAAFVWGAIGKQAATRLSALAPDYFQRAEKAHAARRAKDTAADAQWPDDTYAWKARAALRADNGAGRWQQVVQAVNAMSAEAQRDPTWQYWKARGLLTLAGDSQDGDALRSEARDLLGGIAGGYDFYGMLAADRLGRAPALPPVPAPPSRAERDAVRANPGLTRALYLIAIGLRSEGVREWNFSLRDLRDDRELLAAAQWACERQVWDRCINTSDRTLGEVDMAQRFPTPFRQQVQARSQEIGLDAAFVYGLIRQESRFVMDARSGAGASGLMQLMPATARWTAKKFGVPYGAEQIADRDTNVLLGTRYLKLLLDDFDGSPALAAAAYNAGPGRPRRWRDGPTLEVAAWAENIPFIETRDYVKKVLSNTAYYAALLRGEAPTLTPRTLKRVGPRPPADPPVARDLP